MEDFVPIIFGVLNFILEIYLGTISIALGRRYHSWALKGLGITAYLHGLVNLYMALDHHYVLWFKYTGVNAGPAAMLANPLFTVMLGFMIAHLLIRFNTIKANQKRFEEEISRIIEE